VKAFFWEASNDGSSYYRCTLPSTALGWVDHETARSKDLRQAPWPDPDVLVGSRVANPGPVHKWEQLRTGSDVTLIVDLDDNYLAIDETSNKPAFDFWDLEMRNRLLKAVNLAHRVTVASQGLAEVMAEHHHDVLVVPNGLHAAWLAAPRTYTDDQPVRIGWAGSSSTVHELPLAAKALNRILDYKGPGGQPTLTTIGAPAEMIRWAGLNHQRIRGTEFIAGTDRYLRACHDNFDVWVAPYRSIPFNEAKFPTKALEASFLGIPLIASAIRPYEEWVEHGVTGFLVRQPHEWGKYLKRLVDDVDLRRQMGQAARARASANVMQGLALDWESALTEGIKR
jgi:glycosyltransferase involved in cell wall biosynthesis